MTPKLLPRTRYSIYAGLALTWLAILLWLFVEHRKVESASREKLLNRARDISNTIALVSRSGFPGVVRQSRLEDALNELTESPDVVSVAVLNSMGEVVVQAGVPLPTKPEELPAAGALWGEDSVMVMNPVEFGEIDHAEGQAPTIVIPPRDDDRDGRDRRDDRERREDGEEAGAGAMPPPPPPPPPPEDDPTTGSREDRRRQSGRFGRPDIFNRPPWMTQSEFEELIKKRGLHGFIIVLATESYKEEMRKDSLLRAFIAALTLIALSSIGFAWFNRDRNINLQMRLVRSQEMNEHLREMNLAAAGLAHETRNPLNIVRGLAQLIEKDESLPREMHSRAERIVEEVDNVNHRLNEFIKYSRPSEPRPVPTNIMGIADNVRTMLQTDSDDKGVTVETAGPALTVLADEPLLRQVIFNLILNAIQAVGESGRVRISLAEQPGSQALLIVEDNGPGVPEDMREDIFSPYFTTREQGSGLGLAVVRQIALAHQWEIHCTSSEMGGAAFTISGLKTTRESAGQTS